jgi:YVTN family beta-propeller protein
LIGGPAERRSADFGWLCDNRILIPSVPVGTLPGGVAVTPDGKQVYVANNFNTVSVIATATNTVVATVPVPAGAGAIAIVPPPAGVPFLAFNAKLEIDLDRKPNKDSFELESSFTLSSTGSNGIHPDVEPVTLQVGTFAVTIPPGSFKKHEDEGRRRL